MRTQALDHLVLTVADIDATVTFYERLGMHRQAFGEGRLALRFGQQKINLHKAGEEIDPHALNAAPGSADLCFLIEGRLADVAREIRRAGVEIELGPVERTGAQRTLRSLYLRDPDGNLIELSEQHA
jgi:catechol 2,3-dioxygenase-like lactoylglutathione lyase family enzyme